MNTVVYYPYLYPVPEWIRIAALCWDKIYVVGRRTGYGVGFPDEVESLNVALGGIIDTSLAINNLLDSDLEAQFKRWITAHETSLRDQFDSDPQPLFRIFRDKPNIPHAPTEGTLLDWLVERGLARVDPDLVYSDMHDALVQMPRNLGYQYMGLAAAKAADDGNRDLAADSSEFMEPIFHDARSARAAVATSTLEAYLPADFAQLEPAQLADIRADLASGRLKYQAEINDLVGKYSAAASEGELSTLQTTITEIAFQQVDETKSAYKRAKLATVIQGFGVTLTPPAVATTLASALGIGIFGPAGIAMAISLFGAAAILNLREAKAARAARPWSYVLDVASKGSQRPRRGTQTVRWADVPKTA